MKHPNRYLLLSPIAFLLGYFGAAFFLPYTPAQYVPPKAAEVKIPLYGSSYVGPDGSADDRMTRIEKALSQILLSQKDHSEKLDFVVAAVKKAQEGEVTAQKAAGEQDTIISSVLSECAKCHHAKVADQKGNGYAMFNMEGKYVLNSPRELRKQVKRIGSDNPSFIMPPPPPKGVSLAPKQISTFSAVALADADAQEHNARGKQ